MQTIEKNPASNHTAEPELVEAIIISGPQKGRILHLNGEEVVNAIMPTEKKAIEELLAIYNNYLLNENDPEATQGALKQIQQLREKYRGLV